MIQVNNDVIVMLNWFTNAFVSQKLSTFFSDGTNFLFDPRVIYDPYWNRFVVLADGCTACDGAVVSTLLVAISKTGDPSGDWWIYGLHAGTSPGDFLDFPQMGMDLDSVIITYNDFPGAGGFDARTFALPKAYLYNGLGFTYYVFGGSGCTNAPPYVTDASGVDYLLTFCLGDDKVYIGSMTNSSRSNVSLHLWDNTVAVANHGVPPQAHQPAPNAGYTLDTGDNRFENRSLQVGGRIINTATIALGAFPSPAYYNFDISASPHTLVSEGTFYASQTSDDWHPAINANLVGRVGAALGEVFATWMSTDSPNNVNVQLRAGGGIGDTPSLGGGVTVFTSSIGLTNQTDGLGRHRTGDYAYIALYPAAALGCGAGELGILEGESSGPAAGLWGTHVGIVKHC